MPNKPSSEQRITIKAAEQDDAFASIYIDGEMLPGISIAAKLNDVIPSDFYPNAVEAGLNCGSNFGVDPVEFLTTLSKNMIEKKEVLYIAPPGFYGDKYPYRYDENIPEDLAVFIPNRPQSTGFEKGLYSLADKTTTPSAEFNRMVVWDPVSATVAPSEAISKSLSMNDAPITSDATYKKYRASPPSVVLWHELQHVMDGVVNNIHNEINPIKREAEYVLAGGSHARIDEDEAKKLTSIDVQQRDIDEFQTKNKHGLMDAFTGRPVFSLEPTDMDLCLSTDPTGATSKQFSQIICNGRYHKPLTESINLEQFAETRKKIAFVPPGTSQDIVNDMICPALPTQQQAERTAVASSIVVPSLILGAVVATAVGCMFKKNAQKSPEEQKKQEAPATSASKTSRAKKLQEQRKSAKKRKDNQPVR